MSAPVVYTWPNPVLHRQFGNSTRPSGDRFRWRSIFWSPALCVSGFPPSGLREERSSLSTANLPAVFRSGKPADWGWHPIVDSYFYGWQIARTDVERPETGKYIYPYAEGILSPACNYVSFSRIYTAKCIFFSEIRLSPFPRSLGYKAPDGDMWRSLSYTVPLFHGYIRPATIDW